MNSLVDYKAMSKTELLELKADIDEALKSKRYISLIETSTEVAKTFKGKVPKITKDQIERMIEESML